MYNFFALYHSSTYTFILWTLLSSPLPLSLQNRRIAYVVGALYILLLFLNFINYFIWNNWRLKSFIYHSRLQRAKHNFIRLVKRQSRFFCTSFVEYRRRFYDTTNLCVRNSNHERRIDTTDDGMIFWIDLTHRFDGFIFMANSCYQWLICICLSFHSKYDGYEIPQFPLEEHWKVWTRTNPDLNRVWNDKMSYMCFRIFFVSTRIRPLDRN